MFNLDKLSIFERLDSLTLERLLELKRKIDSKINEKVSVENIFDLNGLYKQLELNIWYGDKLHKIDFLIRNDGILLGKPKDNNKDLYIGMVDKNLNVILVNIFIKENSHNVKYFKYTGKIELSCNRLKGDFISWKKEDPLDIVSEMYKLERDDSLYNSLEEVETINYNNELENSIMTTYLAYFQKNETFNTIIDLILNNTKKEVKVKKKKL